jgi:hypothetical protein
MWAAPQPSPLLEAAAEEEAVEAPKTPLRVRHSLPMKQHSTNHINQMSIPSQNPQNTKILKTTISITLTRDSTFHNHKILCNGDAEFRVHGYSATLSLIGTRGSKLITLNAVPLQLLHILTP